MQDAVSKTLGSARLAGRGIAIMGCLVLVGAALAEMVASQYPAEVSPLLVRASGVEPLEASGGDDGRHGSLGRPDSCSSVELGRRLVAAVAPMNEESYDARLLIQAINHLHGLGATTALDLIDEGASEISDSDTQGLLNLLSVLFVPRKPSESVLSVWHLRGGMARELDIVWYPMVLVDEFPLMYPDRQFHFGQPLDVRYQVELARHYCRLRAGPLRPPNNPLLILDRMERSRRWMFGERSNEFFSGWGRDIVGEANLSTNGGRNRFAEQIIKCIAPPFERDGMVHLDSPEQTDLPLLKALHADWEAIRGASSKWGLRWNEHAMCYEFSNPVPGVWHVVE